ncbi:hypothetical protein EYF80_025692 [Liparis tanakae]|uniref:Uncharacterized protein n=1 Tax=Liparis tanakae TaxID=230148 RepID=A0A4Z2HGM6_9TELE|nr:hypothetical protein EYF80_025692 [Liparis tanakae]
MIRLYFSVEKALFMSGGGVFPASYRDSGGGELRQHQSGMRPSRDTDLLPRMSCSAPKMAPAEQKGGAVQLGLAGGAWMRRLLLASTPLYLGFSTRRRISASRRCRNPGSMAVPPITTRFSESTLRVSKITGKDTGSTSVSVWPQSITRAELIPRVMMAMR